MNGRIKEYISKNAPEVFGILRELCGITAPSHYEGNRAEYCKRWLEDNGAEGVYIDEALNVVFPLNCAESDKITVFAAHTDTVFPDTEPMPYTDDGVRIHSPGVSDDTASVVVLLMMARFFLENKLLPKNGIMFVCNSCEEGLGNLKGTKQLFRDYEGRIERFITFDSNLDVVADRCVGSHRYLVEVFSEGGHSYGDFGNENAIASLARIVDGIYKIEVPEKAGTKTTYNVGTISGGTSVNTIAESASMLCEYRSDDLECLEIMEKSFEAVFEAARDAKVRVSVKKVGDRPCGRVEGSKIEALKAECVPIIEEVIGKKVILKSSSTDCNVPLSLGVPALCVGVNTHGGIHTREEWVDKASVLTGLDAAIRLGLKLSDTGLL